MDHTTALDLAYKCEKWECVCLLRIWASKKNSRFEEEKKQEKRSEKDREKANERKLEGNKYFEEGKFQEALQKYNESLEFDDEIVAVHTNKAGCYIRLNDNENALKCCQVAKKIDPKWIKSYFREGEAYLAMKEYGDAAASFWEGLTLEPTNKVFKEAFDRAVKLGKAQHNIKD